MTSGMWRRIQLIFIKKNEDSMRLQQIFEKIRPQLGSGSRVFGGFVAGSMALNLGPAARQRLQKWFRGADFQAQK